MANAVTHQEYVRSVRKRIVQMATSLLDRTVPTLEAIRFIDWALGQAEVEYFDTDRIAFVAAESETDQFPIGKVRELWSEEALEKLAPEIAGASDWAYAFVADACRSLILRFNSEASDDESEEMKAFWIDRHAAPSRKTTN